MDDIISTAARGWQWFEVHVSPFWFISFLWHIGWTVKNWNYLVSFTVLSMFLLCLIIDHKTFQICAPCSPPFQKYRLIDFVLGCEVHPYVYNSHSRFRSKHFAGVTIFSAVVSHRSFDLDYWTPHPLVRRMSDPVEHFSETIRANRDSESHPCATKGHLEPFGRGK